MLYEILISVIALLFIWFLMFLANLLAVLNFKKFFLNSAFLADDVTSFSFFKSKKNIFFWFKLFKRFNLYVYSSNVEYFVAECIDLRGRGKF